MTRKRVVAISLGLVAAVMFLALGAGLVLVSIDLRPRAERYVSAALNRQVSIGSLKIGWGTTLTVSLNDLRIANAAWGSAPEMARIGALSALIPLGPLLHGVLRFDRLTLADPEILLERNGAGEGNWRWGGTATPSAGARQGAIAVVPRDRTQFPTLIDMALQDGLLIYRTPAHRDLRLDFHALAIRAAGDDQPVHLTLDGAYNGVSGKLEGDTHSFAELRNAAIPFGTSFTLALGTSRIAFDGTLTEPLDFEGVAGKVRIDTPRLGDLLRVVGAEVAASFPAEIAGALSHQGDHWEVQDAQGKLGPNGFAGKLVLDEGARGQPDDVGVTLAFQTLDLKTLGGDMSGGIDLRLDPNPGTNLAADISAKQLVYGALRVGDARLRGGSKPGRAAVDEFSFTFGGGKVEGSANAASLGDTTRLNLRLGASGIAAGEISRALGAATDQIAGPLGGRLVLDMTGRSLQDAFGHSSGQAVVTMTGGRIAKSLVEQASTNLLSLLRKNEGSLPVTCLLGVFEVKDGVVALTPVRLRTPDTDIRGIGRVDVVRRSFDITITTAGGSLLALNLPVRITGDFAHYHAQPVMGSGGAGVAGAAAPPAGLAPELREMLRRSACGP